MFIDDRPENIEVAESLVWRGLCLQTMRRERKAGADADGKIKGRLIKDWSIKDEDSNSICISASMETQKR